MISDNEKNTGLKSHYSSSPPTLKLRTKSFHSGIWPCYQLVTWADVDDGQFDANKFIKTGGRAPGQRSICSATDKLANLSATGSDELFAHARSRPTSTTRYDGKWRAICRADRL